MPQNKMQEVSDSPEVPSSKENFFLVWMSGDSRKLPEYSAELPRKNLLRTAASLAPFVCHQGPSPPPSLSSTWGQRYLAPPTSPHWPACPCPSSGSLLSQCHRFLKSFGNLKVRSCSDCCNTDWITTMTSVLEQEKMSRFIYVTVCKYVHI